MTNQEKKWAHFRITHDLRINDFFDCMRRGGVVLGNAAARNVLTGKDQSVMNRAGKFYDFDSLIRAAENGLRSRKPDTAPEPSRGTRICRLKPHKESGTRCGLVPTESIKPVVDALLKGNARLYTIMIRDAEILYCGKP